MRGKELFSEENTKDMLNKIAKKINKGDFLIHVGDDSITISNKDLIKRAAVKIHTSGYRVITKIFKSGKGDPSNVIAQIEKELKKLNMKKIPE